MRRQILRVTGNPAMITAQCISSSDQVPEQVTAGVEGAGPGGLGDGHVDPDPDADADAVGVAVGVGVGVGVDPA